MSAPSYLGIAAGHLSRMGIRYAFGVAGGGTSLELITALEGEGISYYPVAHEAAGALMAGACSAEGVARAVAVSIKGPGLANLLPGILSNHYENRPAITISEAYGPAASNSQQHKRLDHRRILASLVKGYMTFSDSAEIVQELLDGASEEVPGPVHIDLYGEPTGGQIDWYGRTPALFHDPSREKRNAEEMRQALEAAHRPVIILGSLGRRRLQKVKWNILGVPVLTTAAAKGCINEESEFAGGVITGEIKELSPEAMIIQQADMILAFGLRNTEMVRVKPFSAPLIMIDTVDGLQDGFEPKHAYLVSDPEALALALRDPLANKAWGKDVVAAYRDALEHEFQQEEWMPAQVFKAIQSLVAEAILVLDAGLFCTIAETIWRARESCDFLGSSNGRFMGTGIPTAIGAALTYPGRRVVAVAGDGGIRPYLAEIKLAVEEKLPILFILMSDGGYGTFSLAGRERNLSPRAVTIKNPSWWRAAEAMGCNAAMANNLNELEDILAEWAKAAAPLFLEMHFPPERYAAMTQKLR